MNDYDYMEVLIDENGDYISATIYSYNNSVVPFFRVTSRNDIEYYLQLFSMRFGGTISSFRRNEHPCVCFKYLAKGSDYDASKQEKKYKPPLVGRRLAKRVISLATAGVIAIYGGFASYKYYLKRENIYNNKYVYLYHTELSNNAKIEGEMYNLLANYDSFDEMMHMLVDKQEGSLTQDDLNSFFSNLNLILHSNDDYFNNFYLNNRSYNGALYTFDLQKYFKNNTDDYFIIKRFCSYYNNILTEIQNNSKEKLDREIRKYIGDIGKILFEETYLTETGKYHKTHMLSPLAKYIIFEMARPIIENINVLENESLYKNYKKGRFLEKINSQTTNNYNLIMRTFISTKDNSSSK